MADPSPARDPAEGQTPEDREGQVPADGADDTTGQEPDGRRYSESYVKQLRREAQGYRTELAEMKAKLDEIEDRDKTETERIVERATAAEKRAEEAAIRLLRYEVAAEMGLDPAAVPFLTGSTREEIEHRAEELSKLLQDKKPTASFDGGARQPVPEQKSPEQAHNDLLSEALRASRR